MMRLTTMYEVLDVKSMMTVKSKIIRTRKHIPNSMGKNSKPLWSCILLIKAGTSIDRLNHLPSGSHIKMVMQDRTVWEVFIPAEFKKSKKLLAKRLDAIAFM